MRACVRACVSVCVVTRSVKLTNIADAIGNSVVCFVASMVQTFVFVTKTTLCPVACGGSLCKMFVFNLLCHYMAARLINW